MSKIGEFVTKHPILTKTIAGAAIGGFLGCIAEAPMPIVRNRNAICYDSGKISMHYDNVTKAIEGGVDTLKEALNDTTEEEETNND